MTPKTFIYNNVFHVIDIIKKITTKIEQIQIAHNLHIIFFKNLNLIISQVQIEHLNKLTQTIDQIKNQHNLQIRHINNANQNIIQITNNLNEFFTITLNATPQK